VKCYDPIVLYELLRARELLPVRLSGEAKAMTEGKLEGRTGSKRGRQLELGYSWLMWSVRIVRFRGIKLTPLAVCLEKLTEASPSSPSSASKVTETHTRTGGLRSWPFKVQ
jgi:hypothetical protein